MAVVYSDMALVTLVVGTHAAVTFASARGENLVGGVDDLLTRGGCIMHGFGLVRNVAVLVRELVDRTVEDLGGVDGLDGCHAVVSSGLLEGTLAAVGLVSEVLEKERVGSGT